MRKAYLVTAPFLALLVIAGFLYTYLFTNGVDWLVKLLLAGGWYLLMLLTLVTMPRLGTFRQTHWSRLAYFAAGISCIGLVFFIQHWPFGRALLLSGTSGFTLSYLAYFAGKPGKTPLDWFKVAYLFSMPVILVFAMWKLPYIEEITSCSFLLSMVIVSLYYGYLLRFKNGKAGKFELAEDKSNVFDFKK